MSDELCYCARCGERLVHREHEGRIRPLCPTCGNVVYLNPLPAVAAVLLQSGRVLLIKRGVNPRAGYWALPSGFIEQGETPESALVREVLEETGARCAPGALLTAATHDDHVFGHVLVLAYMAAVDGEQVTAGDDALDARWFVTSDLPPMAFQSHIEIIRIAEQSRGLDYEHEMVRHD